MGRWASPLEVQKMVVAPAKRAACISDAAVRLCKWKMFFEEISTCGREGIRLVYSLKTLDSPKWLAGVACGVFSRTQRVQSKPLSHAEILLGLLTLSSG